ncbi:MAG: hypothetical protein HQL86_04360 [Magnetococcales bacterium]|nr:hypothetical protein [Magnetococcales bacterium]
MYTDHDPFFYTSDAVLDQIDFATGGSNLETKTDQILIEQEDVFIPWLDSVHDAFDQLDGHDLLPLGWE